MKNLTTACMILAMSMGFASASFAIGEEPPTCLTDCEPPPPPPEAPKGNNGWGNGPDSTNSGSFSGGTAVTKSVNGLCIDKFEGKFDGR